MKTALFVLTISAVAIASISGQCAEQMEEQKECMKGLLPPPPPSEEVSQREAARQQMDQTVLDCFKKNPTCADEISKKQMNTDMQIKGHNAVVECMKDIEEAAKAPDSNPIKDAHAVMQTEIDSCFQESPDNSEGSLPGFDRFPHQMMGQGKSQAQGQESAFGRLSGHQSSFPQNAGQPSGPKAQETEQQPACEPTKEERQCVGQALAQVQNSMGDGQQAPRGQFQSPSQGQGSPFQNSNGQFQGFQGQQQLPTQENFQQIKSCGEKISQECQPQSQETAKCLCEAQFKFQSTIHQSDIFLSCLKEKGIRELEPPPNICDQPPPPPMPFGGPQGAGGFSGQGQPPFQGQGQPFPFPQGMPQQQYPPQPQQNQYPYHQMGQGYSNYHQQG